MNLKKSGLVLSIVMLLLLMFVSMGNAQRERVIWLKVSDNGPATDTSTMWFGNHTNARYAIVDTLDFTSIGHVVEQLAPPMPPGFAAYWYNIPGRTNSWDQGLLTYDFRPFPAVRDTFRIKFQGDNSTADVLFKWPSAEYLATVSTQIRGKVGSDPIFDMTTVDSVLVPAAGDNGVIYFVIYNTPDTTTAVHPEDPTYPSTFALHANYPNPFNPSTTIRYDVKTASFVDISIFNVLGQKVVTLVSENHMPGTSYSVTWNGLNSKGSAVSSGMYYARMTARSNNAEEFSALQKLLLVK
jgi:hypothetical protein